MGRVEVDPWCGWRIPWVTPEVMRRSNQPEEQAGPRGLLNVPIPSFVNARVAGRRERKGQGFRGQIRRAQLALDDVLSESPGEIECSMKRCSVSCRACLLEWLLIC